jgi:ankyrin repeat protein
MIERAAFAMAIVVAAPLAGAQNVRRLSPPEMAGIRIWNSGQRGSRISPDHKTVYFTFGIQFKNETHREIDSFLVHLAAYRGNEPLWKGGAVTVREFHNRGVPHVGSILPYEIADADKIIFAAPLDMWRSNVSFSPEIDGATSWNRPDLHDPGHLYTKLYNSKWPDQVALFKKDPSLLKVREANGLSAMLMVFACGAPPTIQYVREHGGNIHDRTTAGTSMMHMAALNGYPGVLDLAVKWGGDVNVTNNNGRTPLDKSIMYGSQPAWQWLLKHGARPHDVGKGPATVWYTIDHGLPEALHDLIAAGMSPRMHDRNGQGLMHYAVENDRMLEVVRSLNVPVDDRNTVDGTTPLMYAQSRGEQGSSYWLLTHGANPASKDKRGRTAYDYAKLSNTLHTDEFFRQLIDAARKGAAR